MQSLKIVAVAVMMFAAIGLVAPVSAGAECLTTTHATALTPSVQGSGSAIVGKALLAPNDLKGPFRSVEITLFVTLYDDNCERIVDRSTYGLLLTKPHNDMNLVTLVVIGDISRESEGVYSLWARVRAVNNKRVVLTDVLFTDARLYIIP